MADAKREDPCTLGVAFIDAQLLMLHAHAALLDEWIEHGTNAPDLNAAGSLLGLERANPDAHAHSEDGTPTKRVAPGPSLEWPVLDEPGQRLRFALHVPCANAILAVASFFDMHRLSSSRTPEVQFLVRLRDAAVSADTFHLAKGEYMPRASFGGLVIDETLDGRALFGDEQRKGFVAYGDVVALLRYLRTLLRSMQTAISAGDAG
jgi:hypothetical protein